MADSISLSFDEFLRLRNDAMYVEECGNAQFRVQADREWQYLKDRLKQITAGKMLGADPFEWSPYPALYPDFLKLTDVALSFETGTLVGEAPPRYRLVLSRRPLRPSEMWPDEEPIPAERCWLSLEPENGGLYWKSADSPIRFATGQFAEFLAVQLVEYQQRYNEALKARSPWRNL